VPADQLKGILEKYPNAVVLSREQYETLLRDATVDPKKQLLAPRRAALTAAKYQARIVGKIAQVTAELTVNVLSEEWSHVALEFDGAAIGAMHVDGEAAFEPVAAPPSKKAAGNRATLLLRGRGVRTVTLEFTIPVTLGGGLSHLHCRLPQAAAGSFTLELPPGQRVESSQPIQVLKTADKTSVTTALPPAIPVVDLAWRGTGAGTAALEALVMANGIYTIDAEKLRAEYGFAIETQLGNLATAYQVAIPASAKVLQVTGDELANWEVTDGKLRITLQPGERSSAKLWLALEMPSLANAASATLTLPVPRIEGLARMQGVFSIVGDAGLTVKAVTNDATAQPAERAIDPTPHFVASYQFNTPPAAPRVAVERVQPRFSADLDTRVEFKPEAIFIERTLTLHQDKGEIFQVALTPPAGEEVLGVRAADEAEPDWRIEDGKLRIRWSERVAGKTPVFKIQTRIEPEKWTQLGADGLTFTLGDAKIDGAEKVTGYIALKADESFRLEAEPAETLERRDGRTTPVQGDYAWFRRQDFALKVKVAKRPGEVLASLIGYALPLEGVLDLNAQIGFQFLHSGARSVRVQVPEKLAQNFHFDGPQIAERNLAGDTWTIVFQKELTGSYALKITAQIPVEKPAGDAPGAAKEGESRFAITVPLLTPLDAVRTGGVWAVEANTETEISFDAKGMNELDSLLAPRLPDYLPRHRVIGVFAWLGKEYALSLAGVRHAPAAVLTSVVDQLDLDTVVSTSGAERNQAIYQLRTAGAQYLDVQLPENSRLLSLTVEGEVVKPVGDRADRVRVQLPAKRDASRALTISVLYETPKGEWQRTGAYAARAPKLAKDIPVLRSQWRLYLPDGFEYTGLESNLRVPEPESERPLVLGPLALYDEWRIQSATAALAISGISDPRSLDDELPPRLLAEARRRASLFFGERPAVEPAKAVTTEALPPPLPAPPSVEGAAEREKARRFDYEQRGREAIESGDKAMKEKDYEKATADYKNACDIIPNAPNSRSLYDAALKGFCDASCKLAEQRITEGRYADAENTLRVVLDERYDPRCNRAIILLARLEQPDSYNKTIGPKFRASIEQVKQWFIEAQGYYDSGRFDMAKRRCEQILAVDKYNIAARKMQEAIERKMSDYGVQAYNETRANAIKETDLAWQRPIRHFNVPEEIPELAGRTEAIRRKLERIIIPKLEFREATIREAIEFLKTKTGELDTDSPPGAKGVNMVLKLEATAPDNPADARITVSLTNIPLIEALRYITGLANLKYKIEPYAVAIVPMSEATDVLVTKEWKIPPDLIPRSDESKASSEIANRESAKNWLIASGVVFNGQAAAVYIPRSNRLIVRNTQDQLDLIDTMVSSGAQAAAPQMFGNVDEMRVSGLLPMKLELPKVGRVIELDGLAAAERVEFRYDDWWSRARRLWLWFVGGALVCLFAAGARPWWRTCWVVLVLSFLPYCTTLAAMPVCNALLAGWLVSVVIQRVAARLIFAPQREEVRV
jgi:tetratricopeptide (TPR) repeat protein